MGDYSGMGSSTKGKPDHLQVSTPKSDNSHSKKASSIEKASKSQGESGAEKSDFPTPAEGSVGTSAELRRRQRSLLGSLEVEDFKLDGDALPVLDVRRIAHVKFDPESQKFTGLPPEWEPAVATNFGLPLALCKSRQVAGYKSRIPNVLLKMAGYLNDHNARGVKGIFRIAPDQAERDVVLEQLANDTFTECRDIHCVSTGIKVWFRELPAHIFRGLEEERIRSCDSDEEAAAIMRTLKEPALSIFEWLLDLSNDIVANSAVNLMTAKNMSIVITPNLYRVKQTSDPNEMLFLAKKFTDFFERCLNNRVKEKAQREQEAEEVKAEAAAPIAFTIDLDSVEASLQAAASPRASPRAASPRTSSFNSPSLERPVTPEIPATT